MKWIQMTKIALTIPTGRPRVKKVVKAFIDNAILHGYNPKDFSVYLSIDTEFKNTKIEDFRLYLETEKKINKVVYITKKEREIIAEKLITNLNLNPKIIKELFAGRKYSRQRNGALMYALLDNQDIAICFDDDEAPFIPVKSKKGRIVWKNLDFFTPHIDALSNGADITRGPYIGYQSPIPSNFEDIPEEIRIKLGEALGIGNDVITRDSFFKSINKVKYLSELEIINPTRPFEVMPGEYGKHIYAGNMGINLNSVRNRRVPIFFTPKNARGEDTIFALQLNDVIVKEVNSFIFHDPFTVYPEIFEKKFPKFLKEIPIKKTTKERFVDALIGWLRYAPILIKMTSETELEKEKKINEMLKKIDYPTKKLAEIFEYPLLNTCFDVLEEYYLSVEQDYNNLLEAQKIWKEKIIPDINKQLGGD